MKTFRTIILLAGILVAGLAINTALAQTSEGFEANTQISQAGKNYKVLKQKEQKAQVKTVAKVQKVQRKGMKMTDSRNLKQRGKMRSQKASKAHKFSQSKIKVRKQNNSRS